MALPTITKLHDESEIAGRVEALAREIAEVFPGDFTIVGVLKGSFVFVADLVRALARRDRHPRVEFIRLSSYGLERESSGVVSLHGGPPQGIKGRDVLLVDDIADTGRSFAYARDLLLALGPARLRTCALVDKPGRRELEIVPDFIGFTVGDVFLVGYGIDYAEQYRHLPYIGTIDTIG